ncbi:MAG: hypothetical protein JO263_03660 [Candidatus Eremiobacteraeota bacterium]|nr:hypothetical protein [Candidatus Eremiobacteraeota bacterium]
MSSRTVFLAKLIGLYALIFGLSMFANKQGTVNAVAALMRDPGVVLLCGIFALSVGISMILAHNVWSGGAVPVAVTVIGWLSAVKGLVLLFLAPQALSAYFQGLHYEQFFYPYATVTLLLGAYLTYGGFSGASSRTPRARV